MTSVIKTPPVCGVILSFAMTPQRHSLGKKHVILNQSAAEVKNLVVR
jgi:hypothetical protein